MEKLEMIKEAMYLSISRFKENKKEFAHMSKLFFVAVSCSFANFHIHEFSN
jgi:hypothetical protein